MRTYKRPDADLSEVPGATEHGGYVYVIAFSNALVKVGKTRHARARLGDHRKDARMFGQTLTDCWVSPVHDCWEENEQALMTLAGGLGGVPLSPEYFNGVSFDALVAKARDLPFPAPTEPEPSAAQRRVPVWFRSELDALCSSIACGAYEADEALQWLTDRTLRDKDFTQLLVKRYVRKSLLAKIRREMPDAGPAPEPEPPEPPEPEPPQIVGLTVSDVLEQLAKAA